MPVGFIYLSMHDTLSLILCTHVTQGGEYPLLLPRIYAGFTVVYECGLTTLKIIVRLYLQKL
jgi:hypothetical protein